MERQTDQETTAIKAACYIHGSQEKETPRATQGHVAKPPRSRVGQRERVGSVSGGLHRGLHEAESFTRMKYDLTTTTKNIRNKISLVLFTT